MVFASISTLLVILTVAPIVQLQDCDRTVQSPVSLPVRNVTLAGNHIRRGLEVHLGTPPQPLAVSISGKDADYDSYYNNTYLYDGSPQCGSLSTNECITIRGGAFDEASSSTFSSSQKFSDLAALDPQAGVNAGTVLTGSDLFTINASLAVEQFSFGIPRTDQMQFMDYSSLGMGKDSSLITTLRNQGSIASRSLSIYWGQTGTNPEHQLDGNLVIGGLDQAKISGNNYTTKLDRGSPCPSGMLLSVSDMSLEFPNGTSASLMASEVGQSINHCVAPEYPIISMPQDIFAQWIVADPQSATDGNADARAGGLPNLWGLVYAPDIIFNGDLKITIDSRLEITIPNHQLVQHYYTFDSNGDALVNDTVLELMINPLLSSNAKDLPKLGMTFLQAAYLHINYDEDTFTLWQANPTTDESLVGIGKSTRGCATASNTASSESSGSVSASATPPKRFAISAGAIAGSVIGAIAFMTILAAAFWYLLYWRPRNTKRLAENLHASHSSDPGESLTPKYRKPELDASSSNNISQTWVPIQPTTTVIKPIELPVERYDR